MVIRKPFYEMSIHKQMKVIVFTVLALFVILCGLINVSIKQLIYKNEDEHMLVTALRLRDQIELVYEKIDNFCINIGEDEAVQTLMKSDYSEMSAARSEATECLTRHMILEAMIEDISLVNDKIHYSNVYRNEELDEMRSQVSGVPFCWLGIRRHSYQVNSGKPDMMVYGGDVTIGEENLGTIVISLDGSDFFEGKDSESNQLLSGQRIKSQRHGNRDDGDSVADLGLRLSGIVVLFGDFLYGNQRGGKTDTSI